MVEGTGELALNFIRQRVAGVLLAFGLILALVCLTAAVMRQSVLTTSKVPSYTVVALKNPTVRSALSDIIVRSVQDKYPVLAHIPTSQLHSAVAQALTQPSVISEVADVAQQIQQHFVGVSKQPIVIGGPALSKAVAQTIAPSNPTLQQEIDKIPFSYDISSSSIPSIGKYYPWIIKSIRYSFAGGLALLVGAIAISAKRSKTLRKIGFGFIGMSVLEVAALWVIPHVLLAHNSNASEVVLSAVAAASVGSIEPIYLGVFGAGIAAVVLSLVL